MFQHLVHCSCRSTYKQVTKTSVLLCIESPYMKSTQITWKGLEACVLVTVRGGRLGAWYGLTITFGMLQIS